MSQTLTGVTQSRFRGVLMMIQSFSAETIIIIGNFLVLTANIILIKTEPSLVLINIILAVRTRKIALVYLLIFYSLI